LYDLNAQKVQISRDVIVNENEAWNWDNLSEIRNVNSHIFTESYQSEDSDEDTKETDNVIENETDNVTEKKEFNL